MLLRELKGAAHRGRFDRQIRKDYEAHLARLRDTVLTEAGFMPQGKGGTLAGTAPASEPALAPPAPTVV